MVFLTYTIKKIKNHGGVGGIRTPGTLPYTRFPSEHLKPLGHHSYCLYCLQTIYYLIVYSWVLGNFSIRFNNRNWKIEVLFKIGFL